MSQNVDTLKHFNKKTIEKFVIGIGNNVEMFYDVLEFIEKSPFCKTYAYCEIHQIIGVYIYDVDLKDFEKFKYYIQLNFDEVFIFRKDESIFSKECKEEILKQNLRKR